MVKNRAFVFLKPHAVTDDAKTEVTRFFEEKDIKIVKEGTITGEEIDKKQLIDQHYYAIASKATILKPNQLNIPKDKFKEKFGEDFDTKFKEGKILNAKDACEKLDIDSVKLDELWGASKKAGNLIKFGGGFYCALVEAEGKEPLYSFNGFFMEMRQKFVAPGTELYWYTVEWESDALSWEKFRGEILGPTDPSEASPASLRGIFFKDWKKLGLKAPLNTGDNAVHASASPFEAFAERVNWLKVRVDRDPFGSQLLKVASRAQIKDWTKDAQVTYGPIPITRSIFDTLEDTDTDYCLALLQMIAVGVPTKKSNLETLRKEKEALEKEVGTYRDLSAALKTIVSFRPNKR